MKLEVLHNQVIDLVKQGQFTKGIEDFYAEDVTQQANADPIQKGRDVLANAERDYESKVTALNKVDVMATAIDDQGDGNGTVFYEVHMQWEHSEAGSVDVQQAVVERWENGKIQHIRFYGTFESSKG